MNITQFRDIVNTVLSASPNLVGSYTLPNGATIPAIYVTGRQGVPAEWKVAGLEVTMAEFPEPRPRAPLNGTVKINQLWELVLTQYAPSENNITAAIDRIIRRFPDATPRYFRGIDISYTSCRFVIPDLVLRPLY